MQRVLCSGSSIPTRARGQRAPRSSLRVRLAGSAVNHCAPAAVLSSPCNDFDKGVDLSFVRMSRSREGDCIGNDIMYGLRRHA